MKNKNLMPLTLVFCLFFLWAISSNLLPTMIRQLMKTCELNPFQASFTESAYWLAYFVCPIPIAMILKRWGYKTGIVMGLLFAAFGCLLFLPGTAIRKYWFYLTIFFIIATGMCFLETAANPYVTVLGNPSTASKRLTLAQSFNSLGAFISAMFLSKLILSGHQYTRATLPASYPGGWDGLLRDEACAMRPPYITLAVVLIVMALVFICCRLPKIKENGGNLSIWLYLSVVISAGESSRSSSITEDRPPSIVCFSYIAASMWASTRAGQQHFSVSICSPFC